MREFRIIIPLVLGLLLVACRPGNVEFESNTDTTLLRSSTDTLLPATNTRTPAPSSTMVASATPLPLPTQETTPTPTPFSTLEPVYPEIQKICPEDRFVPLNKLGLDPQTRLVVLPWNVERDDVNGISLIDPEDGQPQRVANLIPPGMEVPYAESYDISADGKWVNYELQNQEDTIRTVWISSLDGNQRWTIGQPGENSLGYWIGPEAILLFGPERGTRKVINPFTMDEFPLSPLPDEGIETIGGNIFQIQGIWHELYTVWFETDESWVDHYEYRVINYATQDVRQVFEWLSSSDIPRLEQSMDYRPDGTFVAAVNQAYGIDISPELNLEGAESDWVYEQIMKPVFMPKDILPIAQSSLVPSIQAITLFPDYWDGLMETEDYIKWLYIMDYENWIIKDYCFEGLDKRDYSPDGKYLVLTRLYLPSTQPIPKSIFILNLETGYISQIDDWQFIGWGSLNRIP